MRSWLTCSLSLLLAVPALATEGRRSWPPYPHGHRPPAYGNRCEEPSMNWRHRHRSHPYGHVYHRPVHVDPRPVYIPAPPRHLLPPPPPVMIHIRLGF